MFLILSFLVVIVATSSRSGVFGSVTVGTEYHHFSTCGAGMVLRTENRYQAVAAESAVRCGMLCGSDLACKSFDYDAGLQRCYLGSVRVGHPHCQDHMVVQQQGGGAQHYVQGPRTMDGEQLQPNSTCACPHAFNGVDCSHRMQDCTDWRNYMAVSDVRWVWPQTSAQPFQVFCDRTSSKGRTVLMKRRREDLSFARGWADYGQGFGSVSEDHWLGLRHMHLLTDNRRYQLRFSLKLVNASEAYTFATYSYVHVGNESSGFPLTTSPMKPNVTNLLDCLHPDLLHLPFSTIDVDNDLDDSKNCSQLFGGGWWFNGQANCSVCNPTGRMEPPVNGQSSGTADGVFWATNEGSVAVPDAILMFLLPE